MDESSSRLNKAVNSLSEQKKKIDIAMYYTHGDEKKSKRMVSGEYKDIYVIKIKISASSTFGALLLFFNIPYSSLHDSYVIMSHSYAVDDLKTRSEWRHFEEAMEEIEKEDDHDNELTSLMRDELIQAFTIQIGVDSRANELKKYLEIDDEIMANRVIKKFVQDKFGFQTVNLNVDYEQISSLDMEVFSKTSSKVNPNDILFDNTSDQKTSETEESDDDELKGKDIQLVLSGALALSPIKGKSISKVVVGDRIKINLDSRNPKAVSIAKAFDAYNDEKISPITGRVVSMRSLVNGGYKIFCLIAKRIYVKIEEEENNIKVAIEQPGKMVEDDGNVSKTAAPFIIMLTVVFLTLISIVVVLVLL